jgi:outer membrane protein assembly factor BamB
MLNSTIDESQGKAGESQGKDATTINNANEPGSRMTLRVWPGVVAAVLLCVARYLMPVIIPVGFLYGPISAIGGALVIAVWWLLFSRAPWLERVGAIVLAVVVLLVTGPLVDNSIAAGPMRIMLIILAIPVLGLALVAGAVVSRRLPDRLRRVVMAAFILVACGVFTLLRTGGINGEGTSDLHWRWSETPEERLLVEARDESAALPSAAVAPAPETPEKPLPASSQTAAAGPTEPLRQASISAAAKTPDQPGAGAAAKTAADWPGFRGPRRDGIVHGVRIETNWSASPPVKLWSRPIGPGWSSLAVRGDLVYTQEQRGNDEIVSCYNLTTGKPVWGHRDAARFWDSGSGPGPRATPTLSNGRVYTFGATGILNALDARNGAVMWTHNAATDTGAKTPSWGFSGSPLVLSDLVIIAASGRLAAYDLATGAPRWHDTDGRGSYSSPQLLTIGGERQVLLLNADGCTSVAPADGKVLWKHPWPGNSIVQPALTADGGVLISIGEAGGGQGVRRLSVAHGPGGWTAEEVWTSNGLKPYFNDFVIHKGHAFGFDGSILACIDLKDGKRKWKGGRYGHGQLVLLPEQDLLLIVSEEGELALVGATPDQFNELAKVPAIDGKTWNHPALAGNILLVRNGQEMAAFRLSLTTSP